MALITATALTSGSNASSSSIVTASITPGANKLILLSFSVADNRTVSSISGNGLTWELIDSETTNAEITTFVYRAMGSSPSAGSVTVNLSGACRNAWGINELDNVNTTGTNGSGAIKQSAKNNNGSADNLTATLAAFESTDNATFGVTGLNGNSGATAVTPGGGFTEKTDTDGTAGGFHTVCETMFRNDNDTTVDSTSSSLMRYVIIGVEIRNASTMPQSSETSGYSFFM